jgi:hypothetical protein
MALRSVHDCVSSVSAQSRQYPWGVALLWRVSASSAVVDTQHEIPVGPWSGLVDSCSYRGRSTGQIHRLTPPRVRADWRAASVAVGRQGDRQ